MSRQILQHLARLRRRERLLRLLWAAARWAGLMSAILILACGIDWIVDCRQDTPWIARVSMALVQSMIGVIAGVRFFGPVFQRLSDSALSLCVEEKLPAFDHRLISAVQLNQPGPATQGMSPELIAAVTRQAEEQATRHDFALTADHRRLKWSASVAIPLLLGCALLTALWPETVWALVARQFLTDREIPRSIRLESVQPELVWPAGEEVVLRFRAQGRVLPSELKGEVQIEPVGRPAEHYPLFPDTLIPGTLAGSASEGDRDATFIAKVPPSSVDFSYRAWLGDGRTRQPAHVRFEPLPAIIEQRAWLQLPKYYGVRPDGNPYEEEQGRGDILGIPNASARVAITTQKPIVQATLELLGRPHEQVNQPNKPLEGVRRKMELTLLAGGEKAECTFLLQPEESAYRIIVRDQYGFLNADPPRRSIRIAPEEVPQVALLPEQFPGWEERGPAEDFEVDGIPLPLGGTIRIAYTCSAPFGLDRGQLRYRVNDGQWWPLPLKEVLATSQSGPFDPRRGAFDKSGFLDQVEFHALPSSDPDQFPGRKEGGGRFDFQTRHLPNLKVGDKIEFYVEVFDRNPEPNRPPGRSETRMKAIVTPPDLEAWVRQTLQEESRIRRLESKQRRVFGRPGISEPDEPASPPRGTTPSTRRDPPRTPPMEIFAFVRNWQLLGPFPNVQDRGFDMVYGPESEPVDLDKEYAGLNGTIRWKLYRSHNDKIDLERFFNHSDAAVAYALCWVQSHERRSAILATGSDDGIQVWLNRKKVVTKRVHREAIAGEDKTPVELAAGWNEVLVKVDNTFGTWAFFLDFREQRTGSMLEGLTYRITPPDDDERKFVRDWQVLGPFPNPNERGRDTIYLPETEPANLNKEYEGIRGKVRWQALFSGSAKVNLETFFNRPFGEPNVAYAVCWVRSDKKKSAVIATGSVDGIKVWVGRRKVINQPGNREINPGDDEALVELEAGWNEILVKVDNKFGRWAFFLELREPETERPLRGIDYRITPP